MGEIKLLIYSSITTVIVLIIFLYILIQNNKKEHQKAIECFLYENFYVPRQVYNKKVLKKFIKENTYIVTAQNNNLATSLNEKKFVKDFKKAFDKNTNTQYTYSYRYLKFIISFDCSEDEIIKRIENFAVHYPEMHFGTSQCLKKDLLLSAVENNNYTADGKKIINTKFSSNSLKALNMGIFNKQQVYRFDDRKTKTFSKFTAETEVQLWSAFDSRNIKQLNEITKKAFDGTDDYSNCMYISINLLHFLHTALEKNNLTVEEIYGNNVNLYRWITLTTNKEILVNTISKWYKQAIEYIQEHPEKINDIEIKIEKYIEENYNKEISTTTMAEEFGVSPQYFSKYFKSQIGSNFLETVNRYRIKKALDMVRDSEYSMAEIASMTGFNNYKSFARNFKKYTGKIPSEYSKK